MERWLRRLMLRHPLTTALALSSVLGFAALVVTLWVSNALLRHQETQTREHLQREQIASYLDRVTAAGRLIASNQLDIAWPMLDACPDNQRGWEWHYLRGLHQAGLIAETAVDQPILQATIRSDGRVFLVDRNQQVLV
jgi:hypothetical protein